MSGQRLRVTPTTLQGLACVVIERGGPRVTLTTEVGPRILAVSLPDGTGEGLLASLPDHAIERAGWPRFRLHGGHRLWAGPEVPEATYLPDDGPVTVTQDGHGVSASYLEVGTGIRRTISVQPGASSVTLDHRLTNEGPAPVETAPWAITMCSPGGEAWVPRYMGNSDPHGLQPSGSLVLWPYTRLCDERLQFEDPVIRVKAVRGASGPCKIGLQGQSGWIAYHLGGAVLVKRASHIDGATYPDLGASTQCYTSGDFLEIETLGALVELAPGTSIDHRETWSLHAVDPGRDAAELLSELGLA